MAKAITDQIAALKAKQEKLGERLSALSAKAKVEDRKRETRRKIVVGGAILAAVEEDQELANRVREVLDKAVQRDADRQVIAALLKGNPAPAVISG